MSTSQALKLELLANLIAQCQQTRRFHDAFYFPTGTYLRLETQLNFLIEADRLKSVLRRTSPIGLDRKENSAEHSWQVVLAAMILAEHSNEPIDLLRVLKMLAIHDLVEIDGGDTFHYDKPPTRPSCASELECAKRMFGLLPEPQREECFDLWKEFEDRQSAEARFAASIDRLMAFLLSPNNAGGSWKEFGISIERALEKNQHIADGSAALWDAVKRISASSEELGHFASNKK